MTDAFARGGDRGVPELGKGQRVVTVSRREMGGVGPGVLFHLNGQSVFLKLAAVTSNLPPYEAKVPLSSMDRGPNDAKELSQRVLLGKDVRWAARRRPVHPRQGGLRRERSLPVARLRPTGKQAALRVHR